MMLESVGKKPILTQFYFLFSLSKYFFKKIDKISLNLDIIERLSTFLKKFYILIKKIKNKKK